MLDYEGVPFHCRKCHKIGHVAACCVVVKTRPRLPPSWWSGVSPKHYIVLKPSDVVSEAEVDSPSVDGSPHADDIPKPVVAEEVCPSPSVDDSVPAIIVVG